MTSTYKYISNAVCIINLLNEATNNFPDPYSELSVKIRKKAVLAYDYLRNITYGELYKTELKLKVALSVYANLYRLVNCAADLGYIRMGKSMWICYAINNLSELIKKELVAIRLDMLLERS